MAEFDPDAWLKQREQPKQGGGFDPDKYLASKDDSVLGRISNPNSQFRRDVSDLESLAKGVGKSIVSTGDLILTAGDWLNKGIDAATEKVTGIQAPPPPPPGPIRTWISETGAAPTEEKPLWESPEKFGYAGGTLAQIIGTGGGAALGKGAASVAKVGATGLTGEVIGNMLGLPGVGGLSALVLKHFAGSLAKRFGKEAMKDAFKDAMKEAKEAEAAAAEAAKPPPLPKGTGNITQRGPMGGQSGAKMPTNESGMRASPGWTPEMQANLETKFPHVDAMRPPPLPKPVVRVPAGSRPVPQPGQYPWQTPTE